MKREENQTVEYKQSWHDKCMEWICGDANAKGGTLVAAVDSSEYGYFREDRSGLSLNAPEALAEGFHSSELMPVIELRCVRWLR